MPMFNIHLTEGNMSKEESMEMYKEVSEVIAKHQKCPISAVSGMIIPLQMYQMGQGNQTWEEIVNGD